MESETTGGKEGEREREGRLLGSTEGLLSVLKQEVWVRHEKKCLFFYHNAFLAGVS